MLLLLFSQVIWLVAWAFTVFALPLKIFFHNPLSSFATGARQLKTQAQQGNWVPGVLALFSRSLILKQFWQYRLSTRRSSDLCWLRRDRAISALSYLQVLPRPWSGSGHLYNNIDSFFVIHTTTLESPRCEFDFIVCILLLLSTII